MAMIDRYPDGLYPSVQAQNNWWGQNSLSYVRGRVWDRRDDDNLIQVQYEPFLTSNASVLEGTFTTDVRISLLLSPFQPRLFFTEQGRLLIHSGYFYSAFSSPVLIRGVPDYSTDTLSESTCRS